jgi:hypothetical protein
MMAYGQHVLAKPVVGWGGLTGYLLAYGPAQGLPDTKVGVFTQALYDEAKKDGWFTISMKDDWKRVFPFL